MVRRPARLALLVLAAAAGKAAAAPPRTLVVDHTAAQQFSQIPPQWLEAAKALTLHFAHTSHGSQILTGMRWLEAADARYSFAVRENGDSAGLPPAEAPAALRIYDGNPPATYVTPELYWDGADGLASTRAVAGTRSYGFSMWSWCGQQSWNEATTVQRYLSTMKELEAQFPAMRFILFTGHTDGTDTPAVPATLKYNDRLVREYAVANQMVVFDFEDIESWDPAGNHYPNTTDACEWCASWCSAHPSDCIGLPSDCAHSHGFNCVQKARAFWWMMARLAGWEGTSSSAGGAAAPAVSPAWLGWAGALLGVGGLWSLRRRARRG